MGHRPRLPGRAGNRNADHGTFVAGLICWGGYLNPTIPGLDNSPCGVFDLQVLPNDDPAKGETLPLLESEFLVSLESALQRRANELQGLESLPRHGHCVLARRVLQTGRRAGQPAREVPRFFCHQRWELRHAATARFPRSGAQLQSGRITTPADSVLGITVGSVSHVDYKKNGPKEHQPSAFSPAWRGSKLRNQARSDSLRRIMLDGRLAYCRNSLSKRRRLGSGTHRYESRRSPCLPDAGTDLPPSDAHAPRLFWPERC